MPAAIAEKLETLPRANTRGRNPFPDAQYVTVRNVPIFTEHETTGPDGEKQVFDRAKLEHLSANGNRRIQLTGDYSAICVGHTHDPEEDAGDQPETIGFMGPFRLGQLGEGGQAVKYAILADLHIRRDKIDLYNACPRRSVELWYKNGSPEFIDPLSLLSETPRLDLGLSPLIDAKGGDGASTQKYALRYLYSAKHGDMTVVKYAAAAPAFSASGNVLTPSQNYSAERTKPMLSPEDLQQIVDAVSQLDTIVAMEQIAPLLPKLQGLIAAKDQEAATANPGVGENPAEHEALESPSKEMAEEAAVTPEPAAEPEAAPPMDEAPAETPAEPEKYALDEESSDEDVERYMSWRKTRAAKACYAADEGGEKPAEKGGAPATAPAAKNVDPNPNLSISKDKYSKMQEQVNDLTARLARQTDEAREARLRELRQLRIFDFDKVMQRTRYSMMKDDNAFNECIADISENYRPTGVTQDLPIPEEILNGKTTATPGVKKDKYSKDTVDKAIRFCTSQAALGKDTDYALVLDNIDRGLAPDYAKG